MNIVQRILKANQCRAPEHLATKGAAHANAPIDCAGKKTWRRQVAQAATAAAQQVTADWTAFAAGFDAGGRTAAAEGR